MAEQPRNQVVCPRCGEVRLETPPGTTVLPTLGTARKAAMARTGGADDWACDCGRRRPPASGGHEAGTGAPTEAPSTEAPTAT